MRQTRQRTAVKAALDGRDEFMSAQQLHDVLRQQGDSVGLTTVYRSLQALADAGEVDLLVTDDGETVYRRCSPEHHHHLVCRSCGRTVEIAGPAVETWADADRSRARLHADQPHARAVRALRAVQFRLTEAGWALRPPYRRSREAYSSQACHRWRRSKSGQSVSRKTISA